MPVDEKGAHTHPEGLLIPRSVRPVVVVGANVLILFTKPRPADDRATYALNPILTSPHVFYTTNYIVLKNLSPKNS